MAGAQSAEVENFVRAFVDFDGNGSYETSVFNFAGTNNSPYTDAPSG